MNTEVPMKNARTRDGISPREGAPGRSFVVGVEFLIRRFVSGESGRHAAERNQRIPRKRSQDESELGV
jgi:hypothetical protein